MIYIYRNARDWDGLWAEMESPNGPGHHGYPVHPGDLQARVRKLLASGQDWATQSDVVLSILGWMVRTKEITLPLSVTYVKGNGERIENPMVTDGTFVRPWPEEGFGSIEEAGFYYRFTKE